MNKWTFHLSLIASICVGCKQSNSQTAKEVKQMTFVELKAGAERGNPKAQFELGERFNNGNGVLKDSTKAVDWWQKAAAQKFPPAEYNLGIAYGRGAGAPQNVQEGIKWVRMAADSGLAQAQEALGIFYCGGRSGVAQDYSQAFQWFKTAANQGSSPAQYYLALCYRDGKGTPTNSSEAVTWFQRAANHGLPNAQVALGKYYFDTAFSELGIPGRVDLNSPLTKEQHDNPNFFHGVEWLRNAASQGDPEAQERLALAYATGFGTDKDSVEAYKWLTLASAHESNLVAALIESWKTNKIDFTVEQRFAGKQRAEEFSKTNYVTPKSVQEISGL